MPFYENDEEAISNRINSTEKEFYPQVGSQIVRILPTWKGPNDPPPRYFWFEYREHFLNTGGERHRFPSPRTFGGQDPIWDKAQELYNERDPALASVANDLLPTRRYLFNVIILKTPPMENPPEVGKVVVMKVGKQVWEAIVKMNSNKSTAFHTLTMPDNGVNLQVVREGQGLKTRYSVIPVGQRSNIFTDLKQLGIETDEEELSSQLVDLEQYVKTQLISTEQMLAILRNSGKVPEATAVSDDVIMEPPNVISSPTVDVPLPPPPVPGVNDE